MDALDGLKVKQAPWGVVAVCGRGSGEKCGDAIDLPRISATRCASQPLGLPVVPLSSRLQPGSALRLGVRETRMSLPRLPRGNSTPWGCRSKLEHLIGACSLSSRELFDLRPAINDSSVEGMTTPAISLPDITSWSNEE
ncbi:hypothetical protein ASPFODRAFT_58915 [Aspergillus luchuensis CBS 106.47]|uniref:Uncharacterized protein n=1 Tax=Aspergillus luchuensis (strain CBS 106.47) TaxID=1137211 RepID=A0A1M3TN18_ASPLC|nr:hypothetical protein ASPFODRAFT_58915 [Aspergillus luchuensis CBS 106.47]